jgi:hypothetical protein
MKVNAENLLVVRNTGSVVQSGVIGDPPCPFEFRGSANYESV